MANLTLVINDELMLEMRKHRSIKWSNAVRNIIKQKLEDFEEADRIGRKSKLTIKDFAVISKRISKAAAKHAEVLLHENNY